LKKIGLKRIGLKAIDLNILGSETLSTDAFFNAMEISWMSAGRSHCRSPAAIRRELWSGAAGGAES
jgi:hypothetical protein